MKEQVKILVVDDEPGIRDLLSYELGSCGYKVVTAVDGVEALEKFRREKFNIVISDIKMPRMGGLELLDAVKKINPGVEVILSTGYGTIETAVSAMKKGAYDFVQKPFNLDEIFAIIRESPGKKRVKRSPWRLRGGKEHFHVYKTGRTPSRYGRAFHTDTQS